jgi:ferric-dicitrate binding protein FerR (iron transport regulator)
MDVNELNRDIDGTLLLKYVNETAGADERAQVEAWLADDPANSDILLQVARINHAQQTRKRIRQRNSHRALYRVHRRMEQRSRRIFFRKLGVAASLLIGILGAGSIVWQSQRAVLPSQQMITVTANAGMRSQLTLPDGTEVHLNAGSTLIYPSQYDKNERKVHLTGEAYFQVAHRAGQPFAVSAANDRMTVRVLGTEFNLQAYERDSLVQATLIKGSVQLGIQGKTGSISLKPSEQLTYNIHTDKIFLGKINMSHVAAWTDGRLVFKDTPMPEVLRRLTHFYSVDFKVQDEVIRGYTFTGTFENRPLFQILDYMKISSKIDYTMAYPENREVRTPVIHLKKVTNRK